VGDTWITNMTDYLDTDGRIVEMPRRAERLAAHLGAIVVAISTEAPEALMATDVPCRRRPGRRPCPGSIQGFIASDDRRIHWICADCGDNGAISGWEGTPWDARREGPLH
jgi:hypothetical protein